ncbi:MAG: phosphatase PAP2 family protein [Syntrophomonadaceae bacterium]|nr:phosphatase PAP2 family protein [Syntrophomonadaceae bacterium]
MNSIIGYFRGRELKLLYLINQQYKCRVLDIIMQIITNLGSLPAVIAVPLILLLSDHPDYISLGQDMAVVLIISQMMVHTVKFMVYRERPFKVLEDIIANKPPTSKRSFPSGHTCAAFALALPICQVAPGIAPLALGIAALIGVSRVYLGAHYPSDVLAGAGIALAAFHIFL